MDDLVRWLGEQLDEDERIARAALAERSGTWRYVETPGGDHRVLDSLGYSVVEESPVESEPWFTLPHVAEWDPARVLREIDTKRRMVNECVSAADQDSRGMLSMAEDFLHLLALPSADRPGYKAEEWAP